MVISIVAPILLAVATFVVVLCLVVFCYSFAAQRKRKNTERYRFDRYKTRSTCV